MFYIIRDFEDKKQIIAEVDTKERVYTYYNEPIYKSNSEIDEYKGEIFNVRDYNNIQRKSTIWNKYVIIVDSILKNEMSKISHSSPGKIEHEGENPVKLTSYKSKEDSIETYYAIHYDEASRVVVKVANKFYIDTDKVKDRFIDWYNPGLINIEAFNRKEDDFKER